MGFFIKNKGLKHYSVNVVASKTNNTVAITSVVIDAPNSQTELRFDGVSDLGIEPGDEIVIVNSAQNDGSFTVKEKGLVTKGGNYYFVIIEAVLVGTTNLGNMEYSVFEDLLINHNLNTSFPYVILKNREVFSEQYLFDKINSNTILVTVSNLYNMSVSNGDTLSVFVLKAD